MCCSTGLTGCLYVLVCLREGICSSSMRGTLWTGQSHTHSFPVAPSRGAPITPGCACGGRGPASAARRARHWAGRWGRRMRASARPSAPPLGSRRAAAAGRPMARRAPVSTCSELFLYSPRCLALQLAFLFASGARWGRVRGLCTEVCLGIADLWRSARLLQDMGTEACVRFEGFIQSFCWLHLTYSGQLEAEREAPPVRMRQDAVTVSQQVLTGL